MIVQQAAVDHLQPSSASGCGPEDPAVGATLEGRKGSTKRHQQILLHWNWPSNTVPQRLRQILAAGLLNRRAVAAAGYLESPFTWTSASSFCACASGASYAFFSTAGRIGDSRHLSKPGRDDKPQEEDMHQHNAVIAAQEHWLSHPQAAVYGC